MCAHPAHKRRAADLFNTSTFTLPRCVWLCHKVRTSCTHARDALFLSFAHRQHNVKLWYIIYHGVLFNIIYYTHSNLYWVNHMCCVMMWTCIPWKASWKEFVKAA